MASTFLTACFLITLVFFSTFFFLSVLAESLVLIGDLLLDKDFLGDLLSLVALTGVLDFSLTGATDLVATLLNLAASFIAALASLFFKLPVEVDAGLATLMPITLRSG